ncbi:interleukin-12 subunit alpha [Pseudoliparis swirei]|uniref:interleukin-12 subunit alpha n=1 Tax=Pseudoliparis swirei TaxID=2059687 RepID=UPI0024BE679F|nr:interleukin-12 subunit alpha [Pseudoliparis swirei]
MTLYFTPALLLLVLTCAQVSQSVPVASKGPLRESCVGDARALLQNITEVLKQNKLFNGINCSKESVELNMETKTPSVCAPKESTCSGIVKTQFDQESCLTNIGDDLHHYYKFFAAQPNRDSRLALTVLFRLREIMENCFQWSQLLSKEAPAERSSTYDERLSLCKVLKGFQVRSITINRAIAYMNSGEHTK